MLHWGYEIFDCFYIGSPFPFIRLIFFFSLAFLYDYYFLVQSCEHATLNRTKTGWNREGFFFLCDLSQVPKVDISVKMTSQPSLWRHSDVQWPWRHAHDPVYRTHSSQIRTPWTFFPSSLNRSSTLPTPFKGSRFPAPFRITCKIVFLNMKKTTKTNHFTWD